jgi:hypothetical protein
MSPAIFVKTVNHPQAARLPILRLYSSLELIITHRDVAELGVFLTTDDARELACALIALAAKEDADKK